MMSFLKEGMKKIRRQKAMQLRIRQNKKKQEEDQKRPTNKKQAEKIKFMTKFIYLKNHMVFINAF